MYDLHEVYEKLLSGEIESSQAAEVIQTSDIQKTINYMVHGHQDYVPYTPEDLQFIQMIILITQFIYNNSDEETGISDSLYDTLYEIMLNEGGDDIVSAPNRANTKVINHKYPVLRGTLKKVFYLRPDDVRTNKSRKYLDEWISSMEAKYQSKTGRMIDLNQEEVYVFPKFDGLSAVFEQTADNETEAVLTRGDTERNEAQDISHVFPHGLKRTVSEFPKQPYGVKTEVMMEEENLEYFNEKYGTDYKNTRSIVSAILNSDEYDVEKTSLLHVVPLRVGNADGIQELADEVFSYPYIRCRLCDRDVIDDFAQKHKYVGGLRCDGAVIHIINPHIQEILGRENAINNFEVAYKFTEESALTTLEDIVFTVGLFGKVTPVAKVKPVKLKGNTVTNISLGSAGRMNKLKLNRGDTVKVLYDIIPYLTFDQDCKRGSGEAFNLPVFCPECGEKLTALSDDVLFCENEFCKCRIKGRILNYIRKMNIDDLSYKTIDRLYDAQIVQCIEDLYRIHDNVKAITMMSGFGKKKVQGWIDSIDSRRTVRDFEMLGSLGITSIGRKMFQKICSVYTMNQIKDIADNDDLNALIAIPGIQAKTAYKILEGLKRCVSLIEFLEDELTIIETTGMQASRFSVCFTKIRDNEMEKLIKSMGGTVVDSLNKDTTILVIPSLNESSSKITKAQKYGITIVPINDLPPYLLEHFS